MKEFLAAWSPRVLSILRFITGFLFLWHGTRKLFDFPEMPPLPPGTGIPPPMLMTFAGTLELVGGAMIMFGLFTRWTAFVLSGMMAIAYFAAHAPTGFLPLANGGEVAVLYCFIFFYLFFAGGGDWSMDRFFRRAD